MNVDTWIGLIFGFDLGLAIFAGYLVYQKRQMDKLTEQGEKLIEKLVARKEFDFWYNETVRLYISAQEAGNRRSYEKLELIADQHALAIRRYEQARMTLLKMEQEQ